MSRFFIDLKKYWKYIAYKTKADLKAEVTGSYLSWLWLIIEPICFMLIYTFISVIVFHSKIQYFTAFVFIGLTIWNFFQKTLTSSVRIVKNNRDIVTKVYIPKWVLLMCRATVNMVKFLISFALVIITMFIYQIPITFNVLYFIPIIFIIFIFTFGVSCIFLHFGVFIEDLQNLTTIGLRMLFYMSGVFFAIDTKAPGTWSSILSKFNPLAVFITESRNVLIYSSSINILLLSIWGIISVLLCVVGIKTIYKYENTYAKVM